MWHWAQALVKIFFPASALIVNLNLSVIVCRVSPKNFNPFPISQLLQFISKEMFEDFFRKVYKGSTPAVSNTMFLYALEVETVVDVLEKKKK